MTDHIETTDITAMRDCLFYLIRDVEGLELTDVALFMRLALEQLHEDMGLAGMDTEPPRPGVDVLN